VTGPAWLGGFLAVLMIATAAYCVSRLIISRTRHRPAEHDADATHAVMGVAMAGMLTAHLKFLPDGVWAVVFVIAGAWFAWRVATGYLTGRETGSGVAHRGHDLSILLMCGAMIYMLLAVRAAPASGRAGLAGLAMGGGAGGPHFEILALVLALALFGFAVRETDRFPALARVGAGSGASTRAAAGTGAGPWTRAEATTGPQVGTEPWTGAGATTGAWVGAEAAPAQGTAGQPPLSPRLAACCQIAMAVTMAYMLVLML
jgi:hypothetical protein